jgi:hypothetical protein
MGIGQSSFGQSNYNHRLYTPPPPPPPSQPLPIFQQLLQGQQLQQQQLQQQQQQLEQLELNRENNTIRAKYGRSLTQIEYENLTINVMAAAGSLNLRTLLVNGFKKITIYDSFKNNDFNNANAYNNRLLHNIISEESYISTAIQNEVAISLEKKQETIYYDSEPTRYSYIKNRAMYTKMVDVKSITPYSDLGILYGMMIFITTKIHKTIETQESEPDPFTLIPPSR